MSLLRKIAAVLAEELSETGPVPIPNFHPAAYEAPSVVCGVDLAVPGSERCYEQAFLKVKAVDWDGTLIGPPPGNGWRLLGQPTSWTQTTRVDGKIVWAEEAEIICYWEREIPCGGSR